jgi:hypothetical protein
MSNILLSVLIPTVVGREHNLELLLAELYRQRVALPFPNIVQFQIKKDDKSMTVGEKRNLLYQESIGLYSFMPDDDDGVAPDFFEKVLKGIEENPDCITYYEHVDIDGDISKSNHSIKYSGWHDNPTWPEGFKYARTPYFKDVIRTEIAKSVEVPAIRWNEDEQWANALHPLLKNEYHIDEFMYFYKHISSNPTERYGLNK